MADTTITELAEPDLDEAARFLARESTGVEPSAEAAAFAADRLRWLMLDNPSRRDDVPLGWLMRSDHGAIVGAMTCIPQRFAVAGRRFTPLMSANYYVSPPHRGGGLGLFLRYLELGKRFPLFCTTAGPQSGPLWARFGGYAIADQDHEWLGIANVGPVAEEAVVRRTGSRWLGRVVGGTAALVPGGRWRRCAVAGARLEELATADEAAALDLPEVDGSLAAVRDRAFLHWRHFSHDAPQRGVFAYRRTRGSAPSLIVVDRGVRGHRGQIRSVTVADAYGPLEPEDLPIVAGLLEARCSGSYDTLVFRGQPAERQAALRRAGFVRRGFAAPVAWCIDRAGLLPTRDWYLVPADAG